MVSKASPTPVQTADTGDLEELEIPIQPAGACPLTITAIRAPRRSIYSYDYDYEVYLHNPTNEEITLVSLAYRSATFPAKGDLDGSPIFVNMDYKITYKIDSAARVPLRVPYVVPAHGHGAFAIHLTPEPPKINISEATSHSMAREAAKDYQDELHNLGRKAHGIEVVLYDSQNRILRVANDTDSGYSW